MTSRLRLIAMIALGAQLLGCGTWAGRLRRHTYPPDFRYITREQLQSTMWRLAYHTREIDRIMRAPDGPALYRSEILQHLGELDHAAAQIDQSGWPTNHPLVVMNLPTFRRDIRIAREAIERDPPNFLLAAPVGGACVYCHGRR